jgi:hypothetical protein
MARNKKDPLIVALEEGRSFTWTVPDGGDLASMRVAIKHGQTLTMSPINDLREIKVGDIVLLKWHNGHMMHLVQEIQGDQFLIANSVGKINGLVHGKDILGRITKIIEPEPRPSVSDMLEQLESFYRKFIKREQPTELETQKLLSVADDLRWYANRIGTEHWTKQPRSNKWSFEQNLWHLMKQAGNALSIDSSKPISFHIDHGKECVGLAAEILMLFEETKSQVS